MHVLSWLRGNAYVRIVCFVMSSTLLLAVTDLSAATFPPKKYSGEELFTSLLLMNGEALKRVPTLALVKRQFQSNRDRKPLAMDGEFAASLVSHIKRQSPEFFPKFAAAIQSGNTKRINAGLKSMGMPLMDYLQQQKQLPQSLRDSKQFQALIQGMSMQLQRNQRDLLYKDRAYNTPLMVYTLSKYLSEDQEELMAGHSIPGRGIPIPPPEKIPPPPPPGDWPAVNDGTVSPFPAMDDGTLLHQAFQFQGNPGISVIVEEEIAVVAYLAAVIAVAVLVFAIDITPFQGDRAGAMFQEAVVGEIATNLKI